MTSRLGSRPCTSQKTSGTSVTSVVRFLLFQIRSRVKEWTPGNVDARIKVYHDTMDCEVSLEAEYAGEVLGGRRYITFIELQAFRLGPQYRIATELHQLADQVIIAIKSSWAEWNHFDLTP